MPCGARMAEEPSLPVWLTWQELTRAALRSQ